MRTNTQEAVLSAPHRVHRKTHKIEIVSREATFPSRPLGRFLFHVRFRLRAGFPSNPCQFACRHEFSGLFLMRFGVFSS
jgi:hypothetical protein